MTATQPLFEAFLTLLNMLGLPNSRASLLAGLPVPEPLDAEFLVRAAHQKGLTAQLLELSVDELASGSLPVLLLLNGEQWVDGVHYGAGILESSDPQQDQYQLLLFPVTGAPKHVQLNRQALTDLYAGRSLCCTRLFVLNMAQEASPLGFNKGSGFKSWLFGECYRLRAVFRDVLLASVLLNLFALASPLFVMNVYDRVVPNAALETLWVLAVGVLLVFVFDLIIKLLRHYFIEVAGRRVDVVLSSKLFEQVLNLRAEVFPKSVGAFASNLKDFDSIKQFFTATTLTSLVDLPFALLFLLIIYSLGGIVFLAPLVAGLLIIAYGTLVHFPLKRVIEQSQLAAAQKNAVLIETLAGIETLKAFNAEGRQQQVWEQCIRYLAQVGLTVRRLADSITLVSAFLMQVAVVAVVVTGVYQIGEHQMSLGALIACVLLTSRALAPMTQLANLAAQYYQAKTALGALQALSELPVEQGPEIGYLHRDHWLGEIEFCDASFGYDAKRTILKNLNLKVRAGERVALIGKIGSGKSTLMRLLVSLGKVTQGQIKINGIDIDQIDPVELRACTAYVPQEVTLFSGTLRDNILLKAPRASNDELLEAADLAGLGEFVKGNSQGFDLPVGEQGRGLSGGQRQSVAIARAVLNKPSILLFDELTSAMDNQTESYVINNIRRFSAGKTLILSTHRASLLALVDRVVVLDDGRIVADGPKDKVLDALKRGLIQTGSRFYQDKVSQDKGYQDKASQEKVDQA